MYLCDEKSKLLTRSIRLALSDLVTYINIHNTLLDPGVDLGFIKGYKYLNTKFTFNYGCTETSIASIWKLADGSD